jgi:hypothetical protein
VLIDSSTHEFPLGNFRDPRQLFVIGNGISFPHVLDRFGFQQTQVFAIFPVPVGFLSDGNEGPIRNDVRSLQ